MMATLAVSEATGAPLQGLLSRAWPDAAVRMTDALVNGVALGWNPRKTARAMAEGMQQGALQRCLVIARTEQLRVYRQATLETYRASGVVAGYRRLAAKQARTCLACLIEDGRFYALDEEFDAHPQCRCTLVPVLEGMPERVWEKGAAWLEKQPASVQKQVMGLARWELWKSGQVHLGEMVERHEHAVWGGSLGVKAVKTLPGGPEALAKVYEAAAKARAERAKVVAKKPLHYKEYQRQRYAEVQAKSDEDWRRLRAEIERAKSKPLGDLQGHFDRHGEELAEVGVSTPEQLESLFQQHIRRKDLRVFTFISTQRGTEYRQWAFIGMDNGVVALYNEDQKKYWSLYRHNNIDNYLSSSGWGWWIEAKQWFASFSLKPKVKKW